jgi:hypothetical protein
VGQNVLVASDSQRGDGIPDNVLLNAGAPRGNETFLGRAVVGSLLIDTTNGNLYICTATNRTSTITWSAIETETPRSSMWDQVLNHLPLVTTGLIFVIVFARLFVISHGNIQTSRALLSSSGSVEVVVGTLLGLIPFIGFSVFFGAAYVLIERRSATTAALAAGAGAIGLTILVFSGPLFVVMIGLVGYVYLLLMAYQLPAGRLNWPYRLMELRIFRLAFLVFAVSLATLLVSIDTPWLPAEDITLANGDHAVGYVLDTDDGSIVFLTHDDRLVERIPLSNIEAREVCEPKEDRLKPVLRPWRHSGTYPDCPQ